MVSCTLKPHPWQTIVYQDGCLQALSLNFQTPGTPTFVSSSLLKSIRPHHDRVNHPWYCFHSSIPPRPDDRRCDDPSPSSSPLHHKVLRNTNQSKIINYFFSITLFWLFLFVIFHSTTLGALQHTFIAPKYTHTLHHGLQGPSLIFLTFIHDPCLTFTCFFFP